MAKKEAPVDFVTLSDSASSLRRNTAAIAQIETVSKGVPKVVCLDSDTESDGSYTHLGLNGRLHLTTKVCTQNTVIETHLNKDLGSGFPRVSDEKQNSSWQGLRKCSSDRNSWSPTLSLSCKKKPDPLLGYEASAKDKSCDGGIQESGFEFASTCSEDNNNPPLKNEDKGKGIGILRNTSAGTSLVSIDSDDCSSMPAWNDQLKHILKGIRTSKYDDTSVGCNERRTLDHQTEVDSRDQGKNSRGCSFSKCNTADAGGSSGRGAQSSDGEDSIWCKRQKETRGGRSRKMGNAGNDSSKFLEKEDVLASKEAEKQRKIEERIKKRQEEEVKKKQKQEERAQQKQDKEEEKKRHQEERKRRNEEEKRLKEELKAEATKRRKVEQEKVKWEKGKFALQNITALVDTRILEGGKIGGHLLTRFAEKSFKYNIITNPVKKTVIWQMKVPCNVPKKGLQLDSESEELHDLEISKNRPEPQLLLNNIDVPYILVVLEPEEFVDMIVQGDLDRHIKQIQEQYSGFTLCYLINRLMVYLHKREQQQYKNPGHNWTRPPVEQVLAQLVASYDGVHSRICLDEAEVADHIVGLTRSLAECPFKRKLTTLSLSANGDHVVKHDPNSEIIKKDVW